MNNAELVNFWLDILLPILAIGIPVFATLYTVNNRIKNQNKENHQPYVILDKVVDLEELNPYSYHLIPIGRNYTKNNKEIDYVNIDKKSIINVKLMLKNIGYGVATNIKFYNLLTGKQVYGTQESSPECNQKLFTTLDMEAGEEKGIQSKMVNFIDNKDGMLQGDHVRLLCIYHDLHENIFNFIISINAKTGGHYDFFAYQPSSKSYKKWKKENRKEFNGIIKEYKK